MPRLPPLPSYHHSTASPSRARSDDARKKEGADRERSSDAQILESFCDNASGFWSLALDFEETDLLDCQTTLFLDAGYMAKQSRLIEGYLQNLSMTSERIQMPVHIPVPRSFSPVCCSVREVRDALATLYYPDRFPLQYNKLESILRFADFFDVPSLLHKCDVCLSAHAKQRILMRHGAAMKFMWFGDKEWSHLVNALALADRYKLPQSWARLKSGILHSFEDIGQLMDHEGFRKLSHHSQLDILESCVREHMLYTRHNWR